MTISSESILIEMLDPYKACRKAVSAAVFCWG